MDRIWWVVPDIALGFMVLLVLTLIIKSLAWNIVADNSLLVSGLVYVTVTRLTCNYLIIFGNVSESTSGKDAFAYGDKF